MKVIKRIILFIILIILFAGTILTYQGYTMYKQALDKISVKDKVAELQSQKNYTKFEDLPEFYLEAVVAVEDRRFYEHGALDYVGIARAIWTNIKSFELREGGSSITQQGKIHKIFPSFCGQTDTKNRTLKRPVFAV